MDVNALSNHVQIILERMTGDQHIEWPAMLPDLN